MSHAVAICEVSEPWERVASIVPWLHTFRKRVKVCSRIVCFSALSALDRLLVSTRMDLYKAFSSLENSTTRWVSSA